MNWLDITLIVVWIVFIAAGAKLGSIWTGSCVVGGFFGALLADYYNLPLAEMLGNFPGSIYVSTLILFIGGLAVLLIPGALLSRISSALFLGMIDSLLGLIAGTLVGLVVISLVLLFAVPAVSKIEDSRTWKKSKIVKPLHDSLEQFFDNPSFGPKSLVKELQEQTSDKIRPATKKAMKNLKNTAGDFVEDLRP